MRHYTRETFSLLCGLKTTPHADTRRRTVSRTLSGTAAGTACNPADNISPTFRQPCAPLAQARLSSGTESAGVLSKNGRVESRSQPEVTRRSISSIGQKESPKLPSVFAQHTCAVNNSDGLDASSVATRKVAIT